MAEAELEVPGRYERGSDEFSRLLAFSDGVFAIAMTLLVVAIVPPVLRTRIAIWASDGSPSARRLAEVGHPEQQDQGRDRYQDSNQLAGDPADRAGRAIEVLRVEDVQQAVRHPLPLFLRACGVSCRARAERDALRSRTPIRPWVRGPVWFPRSPRANGGD